MALLWRACALELNSALNLHISNMSSVAYEQSSIYNIIKGIAVLQAHFFKKSPFDNLQL